MEMFGVKIRPFPRFLRALGLWLMKKKKKEDDDEKIEKSRMRENCSSKNAKIPISLKGIAWGIGGSVDLSGVFLRLSLLFPGEKGGRVVRAHVKSDPRHPYIERLPTLWYHPYIPYFFIQSCLLSFYTIPAAVGLAATIFKYYSSQSHSSRHTTTHTLTAHPLHLVLDDKHWILSTTLATATPDRHRVFICT